jgi:acetyl-CoA C-acetyltransferase
MRRAAALDVGSVGAACNFSLNEQGLLAGLMAMTPGLAGKPIEAVENACASGGQAVLSVIQKLQLGMGETGIAVGYEKMRDAEGKMDGKLIGKVLGYFSHPEEREGKVFVFPHYLRRSDARAYMAAYGVTEARSGRHRRPGVCQRQVQSLRADEQGADHARSGA